MHNARVLIVEDDPISAALMAGWARHQQAEVMLVGGTTEADDALAHHDFDLILSDVHLPGNDGLCWVERVLALPRTPPLVLITGNPELGSTLRAANLPVAGYLVKPPNLTALTSLAERLVLEHRRRRELRSLSEEATRLLVQPGPELDPLRTKLLALSRGLENEAERNPRTATHPAGPGGWHLVINDAIATLEKTRHSFRSKELGRLRQRLQQFLDEGAAA